MDIKERLAAMTSNLGPITVQELTRYGADANGRHGHGFSVECDGKTLAEVQIRPRESEQTKVDEFAQVLFYLLSGSEGRVLDREDTIANLRGALNRYFEACPRLGRTRFCMEKIDPNVIISITQRAIDTAREQYDPDDTDETLDSWLSDLEVECASDHGFDPSVDEDAAMAAQCIFRGAFLAAVGRDLSSFYAHGAAASLASRLIPVREQDARASEHVLELAPFVLRGYVPETERREGSGFFLHLYLASDGGERKAATFEVEDKNTVRMTWIVEPTSASKRASLAQAFDLLVQEGYTLGVAS